MDDNESELRAPYARVGPVINTLERIRNQGLPDLITPATLQKVGLVAKLGYQTTGALAFLGLIAPNGKPTDAYHGLRRARAQEYQGVLAEIIRNAYHPVFAEVDPAQADTVAIADAFRRYEPQAQRDRMVYLFLGLCRAAGLAPQEQPRPAATGQRLPPATGRGAKAGNGKAGSGKPAGGQAQKDESLPPPPPTGDQTPPAAPPTGNTAAPATETGGDEPYPLIIGLVHRLPKDGKWNQARHDAWVRAVLSLLDVLIEIEPDQTERKLIGQPPVLRTEAALPTDSRPDTGTEPV